MTLFVNLSTLHDYSLFETIGAFATLTQKECPGCLQTAPGFFQYPSAYAWIIAELTFKHDLLINPYKLGEISTDEFYDNLAEIFYFMKDMDEKNHRNALFKEAWISSIKIGASKEGRLDYLVERAEDEAVFIVSNTNELDVKAAMALFKAYYVGLDFNATIERNLNAGSVDGPIEILPNVFLCLSYQMKIFKEAPSGTPGLIEKVLLDCASLVDKDNLSMVSNHEPDLKLAEGLGFTACMRADDFYAENILTALPSC